MKKLLIILLVSTLLLTGCGGFSGELKELDKDKVKKTTEEFISLVIENDYETILNDYVADSIKNNKDFDKLQKELEESKKSLGTFKKLNSFEAIEKQEDENYICVTQQEVEFEKGTLKYHIGYDKDYKIIVLYIK